MNIIEFPLMLVKKDNPRSHFDDKRPKVNHGNSQEDFKLTGVPRPNDQLPSKQQARKQSTDARNTSAHVASDVSGQQNSDDADSNILLHPHVQQRRTSSKSHSWNPFAKLHRFYMKMTNPKYNKKVDVYIYMFLCEFVSFWIIIFGYVSFGPSTGMGDNAFEFIKSNRIPLPFISMLLVQFIVIISDRGLFLRKQVLGKFIFQIIHVVLIHGWLSFILPHITKSR